MADYSGAGTGGAGGMAALLFLASADTVYQVFGSTNSSPQTTELFAGDRAHTLWKYVKLGHLQAGALVGFAAWIASKEGLTIWPVIGGIAAGTAMHLMYAHALKAGRDGVTPTLLPR